MLDPTLRALFVGLLIVVLRAAFQFLNVEVDDAFLTALATAIIAWILGNPAGSGTAAAIHRARAR